MVLRVRRDRPPVVTLAERLAAMRPPPFVDDGPASGPEAGAVAIAGADVTGSPGLGPVPAPPPHAVAATAPVDPPTDDPLEPSTAASPDPTAAASPDPTAAGSPGPTAAAQLPAPLRAALASVGGPEPDAVSVQGIAPADAERRSPALSLDAVPEDVRALLADGFVDVEITGRGASATVYRARHALLGPVAVKVLERSVAGDPIGEVWRREARALAAVSAHPHVVTLLDAGVTSAGRPYLVLDHADGGSLADAVRRDGAWPVEDVLAAGVALASALEVAHGAGVVHGDVAPANVLVSDDRGVELADFGVARLVGAPRSALAQGTPGHAAPEVVAGATPTVASDVYGLASTLRAALVPSSIARANDAVAAPIGRPSAEDGPPHLPRAVVGVLDRALATDPGERHPSARALADDLRAAQAALGLPATPVTLVSPSRSAPSSGRPSPAPAPTGAQVAIGPAPLPVLPPSAPVSSAPPASPTTIRDLAPMTPPPPPSEPPTRPFGPGPPPPTLIPPAPPRGLLVLLGLGATTAFGTAVGILVGA